jgi:hypothetical protein
MKTIYKSAKLLLISIFFIWITALGSHAATLRWEASSGNPDGYKVYYGTNASNPSNSKDVGNVNAYNLDQLPLSENVQYYFCVSAYNAAGESPPCPPVGYSLGDTTPPTPPVGLVASIQSDSTPTNPPSSGSLVSNLAVATGKNYQVLSGLDSGHKSYIDRSYSYQNVPDLIKGATYIKTANDDKMKSASNLISFDVSSNVTIYVAHDDRIRTKPGWLKNFNDTGKNLKTDVTMSIYKQGFAPGRISLGANGGMQASSMYTVAVASIQADSSTSTPSGSAAVVSKLSVASGKAYKMRTSLANGKNVYIDRTYSYNNIPSLVSGATYIETANDDKLYSNTKFVSFDVNRSVTVYVAHDDRITTKPSWLKSFTDTGKNLTSDVPMSLYKKNFSAGRISLGGNGGVKQSSMYTIAIE